MLVHSARMAADGLDEDIIPLETTQFDAIVLGTGLCESMVAAGLARAGKSVLHLDHRRCMLWYGG